MHDAPGSWSERGQLFRKSKSKNSSTYARNTSHIETKWLVSRPCLRSFFTGKLSSLILIHSSAAKVEEDPVIAEYDVFLTPPIEEHVYLLQYPNRPRNRPYSSKLGASPEELRIKPKAGYLEMDIGLNTEHNFNKYMGLKWGDATRVSKEVQNSTGTYGPASGLISGKRRVDAKSMKEADRELGFDNDLRAFQEAAKDKKVHHKQTLGGQIIKHDGEAELGKPSYFVGAFKNDQLHLTKITGTAQMRPQFHHVDAEEQRARIAASRAQAEAGAGADPVARAIHQRNVDHEEKNSTESKLRILLSEASKEPWINMDYVDEEEDFAFAQFNKKLKIEDTSKLAHLKSEMNNEEYLDAISAPKHGSPTRRRKRAAKRKETVELEDDDADDADEADAEGGG